MSITFDSRKLFISLLLGWSGFFCSLLSFKFYAPELTISLQWSPIFPLIASMAYGRRYGLIAAIPGFGAFFPFLIWPNNGWACLPKSIVFILFYLWHGISAEKHRIKPSLWNHPLVANIPFIFIFIILHSIIFPIFLSDNPPFWYAPALLNIPPDVLNALSLKESVLSFFIILAAATLLMVPSVRSLLQLPERMESARNNTIFFMTSGYTVLCCLLLPFLDSVFTKGVIEFSDNFKGNHGVIVFFFIVTAGIICMNLLMHFSERQQNSLKQITIMRDYYSNILNSIPDPVFVKDDQHRLVKVNDAWCDFWGFDREGMMGNEKYCNITDEQILDFQNTDDFVIENGHNKMASIQVARFNGQTRNLVIHKSRYIDNAGNRFVIGTARDVTERRKAEEKLRRLSIAVDQSLVTIIITGVDGSIEYVNPKFSSLTGYDSEEVIGKNVRILKSDSPPEVLETLWKTITSGHVWEGELLNRKKNGNSFLEHSVISPIKDDNGQITGYIAVKDDITEQRRLEDQLQRSQKMDAIGRLSGGVAHDYNNKLTVILGYAELAKVKMSKGKLAEDYIDEIIKAAKHSQEITKKLLTFSRNEVVNPLKLDINLLLAENKKSLGRLIGENLQINFDLAPDIWPIRIDSTHFDQIIMNLAINASDAIPDSGTLTFTTKNISVTSDDSAKEHSLCPGEYVMLSVSDTGTGIEKSIIDKIFEPFFTTKDVGKGTGLGLSTVYGIVTQNQGAISVHSKPSVGTTFNIYFPRMEETETPVKTNAGQQNIVGVGSVLVVEDEESVRTMVCLMLELCGYRVISTDSPEQAIALISNCNENIDCVLSDVIMPGMNGRQMQSCIYNVRPSLPFVFMSGYTSDVIDDLMADDSIHFIQKPFNARDLNLKLRKAINNNAVNGTKNQLLVDS